MKAQTLFAEKGYSATSMADIAEACEVQKATLYHYFESKEALLFGIFECHAEEGRKEENFCRLFMGNTLEERLYQLGKYHLEQMDQKEHKEFLKVLLMETATNERMKECYTRFITQAIEEFALGAVAPVCQGCKSEAEVKRLAYQYFAALMHYSWQTRMVGSIESFLGSDEDYIRDLARIFGREC